MKRRLRAAIASASLLGSACATAPSSSVLDNYPAGVSGRTSVIYYDVQGSTFQQVRSEMRRLGPKTGGNSFFGETRSPIQWHWHSEPTGAGSCMIRQVTVSIQAEVTLPRWTAPSDAEPGLATEWARFIAALETHEAGHKDISAKAGRDILHELSGLSGLCSQVGDHANDIARAIVARSRDEQQAYDAATRHGATQGTSFGANPSRYDP